MNPLIRRFCKNAVRSIAVSVVLAVTSDYLYEQIDEFKNTVENIAHKMSGKKTAKKVNTSADQETSSDDIENDEVTDDENLFNEV
jgi:hypothetical protein